MSGRAGCFPACYPGRVLRAFCSAPRSAAVLASALVCGYFAMGCSSTPPARFKEGGAPLAIDRARWERGDDHVVDLMPDGRVLFDGVVQYHVDIAGRVYDKDHDAVALLLPDGVVVGNEEAGLGIVGTQTASPPGGTTAWLLLQPTGRMVAFDQEGRALDGGVWKGCEGPVARTCLLIGHIARVSARQQASGPVFGFGIGFGVGGFRR